MAHTRILGSSAGHGLSEPNSNEAGFTLAEAVVSITLFVIISVSTVSAVLTLVATSRATGNRVRATNLARQQIEKLRLENDTKSSTLDVGANQVTVGSTTYTVTSTVAPDATATCNIGSSRAATVVVSWNNDPGRAVRFDTVLSC